MKLTLCILVTESYAGDGQLAPEEDRADQDGRNGGQEEEEEGRGDGPIDEKSPPFQEETSQRFLGCLLAVKSWAWRVPILCIGLS